MYEVSRIFLRGVVFMREEFIGAIMLFALSYALLRLGFWVSTVVCSTLGVISVVVGLINVLSRVSRRKAG